jgi:hypothetical protein
MTEHRIDRITWTDQARRTVAWCTCGFRGTPMRPETLPTAAMKAEMHAHAAHFGKPHGSGNPDSSDPSTG